MTWHHCDHAHHCSFLCPDMTNLMMKYLVFKLMCETAGNVNTHLRLVKG